MTNRSSKMTKQQRKVYEYIANNRGCTTKEIMMNTGIQCPSGRITELRDMGIKIISIGQQKYPGTRAFEKYAIDQPAVKTVSRFRFNPETGGMVEHKVQVPV